MFYIKRTPAYVVDALDINSQTTLLHYC